MKPRKWLITVISGGQRLVVGALTKPYISQGILTTTVFDPDRKIVEINIIFTNTPTIEPIY